MVVSPSATQWVTSPSGKTRKGITSNSPGRTTKGSSSTWGDGVFERVSEDGETLGFAVLNVSARKQRGLPFEVTFEKEPGDA